LILTHACPSAQMSLLKCLCAAIPARERVITCEEAFELQVPPPDHPNRVGAAISAAMKAGTVEHVGFRQSARPSRHAGVVRVWVGGGAR
jgi:type IV secretory pathway ATPase VirB11/archaellum biosynthesis ATPase